MTHISPIQFKEAFLKAVASVSLEIVALWDARRDYTAMILDVVLPKVATNLGICVYNGDYYYLDSIFYREHDCEHFGPSAIYAKSLSIALEHEHDPTGTAVEMNKLQLFNAPLKVLITYAQTASLRDYYLERYTKIVRDGDVFGDFATLRRQLVIFGRLVDQIVTWDFYLFGASGFEPLA